jgi:Carboxypeptidase regulatory-like domain/TonB dependent receptor
MKAALLFLALLVPAWAKEPSLHGTVTDPSSAVVPDATVQLRGPGREQRAKTDPSGKYAFPALTPGKYVLHVTAKGFAIAQKIDLTIERPTVFDVQLVIGTRAQVINVEDQLRGVSTEPEANGSAIVVRERQIAALSDDPDELALQLQALAGPAPGPGGGQIFIDGFTGGYLPPKSSIREVRINANPFSPEYDRPGFSRVEIFTKPGTEALHGQAFAQIGDAIFNSRNPLLTQSTRPPYRSQFYGLSLSGPIRKNKASFSLDAEHRQIGENAFILATTPESSINQALATPQSRLTLRPRFDVSLTPKNTLVARYQYVRSESDNQGAGDFNLASRAYNERQSEQAVQITETAMVNPRAINETRFQYLRAASQDIAGLIAPIINVEGAFTGGGATVGNSGSTNNNWELTNLSTYTRGRHMLKWGGRLRQSRLTDLSVNNFAGTFTFYTLADYRDGRPAMFTISSGTPVAKVSQTDAGLFVSDDWRVRPKLTISYGVRYEAQNNFGGTADWAPRVGIAWELNKKTVLRVGAGAFYDRIPLSVTLDNRRYDGVTQQSYVVLNPTFYPAIPPLAAQPQQTRPVAGGIRSPRLYQASAGIERQLTQTSRLTVTWVNGRGVHLLDVRNLDQSRRLLTESAGLSRQNQVVANLNGSYKKLTILGNYALSYGRDDNEGLPADPNNLRAEWGPSSYGDIRHRGVVMASTPLFWKFVVSPFFVVNSGPPYNITTGLDPNHTGAATARPGLVGGACQGAACFNLNPALGTAIEHNYGRGPGAVNVAMRLSRTWGFGPERAAATADAGHGGLPPSVPSGRRYGLTLSASTMNALNHVNFAPPNGDLSSPYFGQYRALGGMIVMNHGGGASTYNRKIDLQLRFTF